MNAEIRSVSAETTRSLRHQVLRPNQDISECAYPGDDHPDSFHAAAYVEGKLVGVSSIFAQDLNDSFRKGPWRIRGMAVLPEFQGKNIGRQLLDECVKHAQAKVGSFIWCNSRVSASAFYFKSGFEQEGEGFDLPGIGPHYLLLKKIVKT